MSSDSQKICCFTGHRRIDGADISRLPEVIDVYIEKLISLGVRVFRAGGAMGFDTIAALKVIEKKTKYPDIKLDLCLPCKNQTSVWSGQNRDIYDFILTQADSVVFERESYTSSCMFERNRRLVRGSDYCLCYCSPRKSGSSYTLNYARESGVRIINLYEIIKNAALAVTLD